MRKISKQEGDNLMSRLARKSKTSKATVIISVILFALFFVCAAFLISQIQLALASPVPEEIITFEGSDERIVVLDPGHGYGNTNVFQGYDEQVRMLALAHKIRPLLEAEGITVLMTRDTEENVLLPVRAAKINLWALEFIQEMKRGELEFAEEEYEAQILQYQIHELDRLIGILHKIIDDPETYAGVYFNFPFDNTHSRQIHPELQRIFEFQDNQRLREQFLMISLHSNAPPNPIDTSINGADAFFVSNNLRIRSYFANYTSVNQSAYFAERIIENIDTIGIRRGRAFGTNFLILRETNVPAVLVENGYHTNPEDREKLLCDIFLADLAVVYRDTILAYFDNISEAPEHRPTIPRILGNLFDMF